ncbi:MAG: peptidoglycan DD-metalloendopeptidase family protein [Actinomycetota bacterium]
MDLDPTVGAGGGADAECRHPWVAPVDAAVVDPFRPPDGPSGPGNRGIEYGTESGQPVVAIGGGLVDFAGPVAGHPVVVIDHGAGLRSSYVNLLDRSVDRGQLVERGQPIALADAAFHLGVRRDGIYLDPSPLLSQLCEIVRLVALPSE